MLWQECLTQKKIVGMSFKSFPWLNHFCRLLAYGYLKFVETSNKNSFITVFFTKSQSIFGNDTFFWMV